MTLAILIKQLKTNQSIINNLTDIISTIKVQVRKLRGQQHTSVLALKWSLNWCV